MTWLWLATIATSASPASEREIESSPPAAETGVVIGLGQRGSAALGTVARYGPSLDTTTHLSVEVPLDQRTGIRFEAGYFPIRDRVHVAVAARGYPAERKPVTGFLEVGTHVQRAGTAYDTRSWVPTPARLWVAPLTFGLGGRLSPTPSIVFDAVVSGGPMLEFRLRPLTVGLGIAATASLNAGVRF